LDHKDWLASLGPGADGRVALGERLVPALPRLPAPVRWTYVPGRIEVFGKHTDYAGGRSLVCAATRGICGAFQARDDRVVRVTDVVSGETVELPIAPDLPVDRPGWHRYPATVVRRLARNFPLPASHSPLPAPGSPLPASFLRGLDLWFASDLPQAAGMSSSSALMVTVLLAMTEAGNLGRDPAFSAIRSTRIDLAAYAACVENGAGYGTFAGDHGVGTTGGSEDHTAMLCSAPGQLGQYAFVPPRLERSVALDEHVVFAIGVSGIVAEKTGAAREAYNAAAARAAALLDLWRHDTGRDDVSLAAAMESSPGALEYLRGLARAADRSGSSRLLARLDQFAQESQVLVPTATEAFASSDWRALGELSARSHRAADEWLGNQVPETNTLVATALEAGALAASAFGAGFGGSAWALVPRRGAAEILARWQAGYCGRCPGAGGRARFLVSGAGPSAAVTPA
jgi:galactokinase